MSTITSPTIRSLHSVADLIERLGGIPAERIRLHPLPGTATEDDLIRINEQKEGRLCELIDGTLVEKPVAVLESRLAALLVAYIQNYLWKNRIGIVFVADAMFRLKSGRVRLPDVAFVRSEDIPGGKLERRPITDMPFALAVEILSVSNTAGEMDEKRAEYFANGTQQMWIVDPDTRTVRVYHTTDESTDFGEQETLDGGDVLPGFSLPIHRWFEEAQTV